MQHKPSATQQALYLWDATHPGTRALHLMWGVRVTPAPAHETIERALAAILRRFPVLRSRYDTSNGSLGLVLLEPSVLRLHVAEGDPRDWLERPFALEQGPLFELGCFAQGSAVVLAFRSHHAIMDLRSIYLITRAFFDVLGGQVLPEGDVTSPSSAADEAAGLKERSDSPSRQPGSEADRAFFRRSLAGLTRELPLPRLANARSDEQRVESIRLGLDPLVVANARSAAKANGCTLFGWIFAAWAVWLAQLSRTKRFAVGVSVLGRQRSQHGAVGAFANVCPVPITVDSDASFAAHAQTLYARLREAKTHASVPFATVLQDLAAPRVAKRQALVDAVIHHHRIRAIGDGELGSALPGHRVELAAQDPFGSQFDLLLDVEERGSEHVDLICCFRRDVFDPELMRTWAESLRNLIGKVSATPDVPVSSFVETEADRDAAVTTATITAASKTHPLVGAAELFRGVDGRGHARTALYVTPRAEVAPKQHEVARHVLALTTTVIDSVIVVPMLPRNEDGSLRMESLPPPPWHPPREYPFEAPTTALEKRLAAWWAQALALEKPIGRRDNFFDLGGDSMILLYVCKLAKSDGLALEPLLFFSRPVLRELAEALE